jgi:hypothetical protein
MMRTGLVNARRYLLGIVVAAVIGLLIGALLSPVSDWIRDRVHPARLTGVAVDGQFVKVLGERDQVVADLELPSPVSATLLHNAEARREAVLFVGTDETGATPGHIVALGLDGRTIWEFPTYDEEVMSKLDSLGWSRTMEFRVTEIKMLEGHHGAARTLVALAIDPLWFTTRIMRLDPASGQLLSDFWNPGRVMGLEILDLDGDGTQELVFWGCHNRLRQDLSTERPYAPVAFAVEPEQLHGQPYPGAYLGIPVVSTLWYLVFMPIEIGIHHMTIQDGDGDGRDDAMVALRDGRYYHVNYAGRVVKMEGSRPGQRVPIPLAISQDASGVWGLSAADAPTQEGSTAARPR